MHRQERRVLRGRHPQRRQRAVHRIEPEPGDARRRRRHTLVVRAHVRELRRQRRTREPPRRIRQQLPTTLCVQRDLGAVAQRRIRRVRDRLTRRLHVHRRRRTQRRPTRGQHLHEAGTCRLRHRHVRRHRGRIGRNPEPVADLHLQLTGRGDRADAARVARITRVHQPARRDRHEQPDRRPCARRARHHPGDVDDHMTTALAEHRHRAIGTQRHDHLVRQRLPCTRDVEVR